MKVNKIQNQQKFTSAYACVNGEWLNLSKSGKKVSVKAIKENVESHALDYFTKGYSRDKSGNVIYDNEYNSLISKIPAYKTNVYKKNAHIDFLDIMNNADVFVRFHKIGSTEKQPSLIHMILTGKEAVQEYATKGEEKGKFIRTLFKTGKVDLEDRNRISYNIAPNRPEPTSNFKAKHGHAWYEAARTDFVVKDSAVEANIDKLMQVK